MYATVNTKQHVTCIFTVDLLQVTDINETFVHKEIVLISQNYNMPFSVTS